MSANGYAETRPIGDNRDLNRRIEVRILFSGKLETPRGPER
jgi:flagellar motor protein MotB